VSDSIISISCGSVVELLLAFDLSYSLSYSMLHNKSKL